MHTSRKSQFRTNCMRMMVDIEPTYEITFNFGTMINPILASGRIEEWCKRVERKAFGKKWYKRTDDRLLLIAFPEHLETTPHWHGVARLKSSLRRALKKYGEEIWLKLVPRGQLHFSKIRSLEKVKSYFTKELHLPGRADHMFVYVGARGGFSRPLKALPDSSGRVARSLFQL